MAKRKAVENENLSGNLLLIQEVNKHDLQTLETKCFSANNLKYTKNGMDFHIDLETAETISEEDFESCFQLIEETSSDQYRSSAIGWSPVKKKNEMRLTDMRYLLVRKNTAIKINSGEESHPNQIDSKIMGFLSFMFTIEDDYAVVYCYEIHLKDTVRGLRLGQHLMNLMEEAGSLAGLKKAMLTVFTANKLAFEFYKSLGYTIDESSPPAKKLRNGTVKHSTYWILSKTIKGLPSSS